MRFRHESVREDYVNVQVAVVAIRMSTFIQDLASVLDTVLHEEVKSGIYTTRT